MKVKWMKKMVALMAVGTMVLTLFAGCGSKEAVQEENPDSLNIMVWEGTWSEEIFKDFTKETGIEVNISYIDNTDTLLSKLVEGSAEYDLIDLEGAYVQSFVDGELLAKIDKSSLKNLSNIKDEYLEKGPIGDEEGAYTITNMGPGYTSVVYNKETCPVEIHSLKDLADPALKGQIAMVNSTISLYGAALVACGYEANSTDEAEMKEANDLLKEIKKNVKAFVGETAVSVLENGECSVALCWDYMTLCNDNKENWDKFEMVELEDGCEQFIQYWAIPSSSTKQAAATQLIDFLLRPEEASKSYVEYGGNPNLKEDVLADYVPQDYYENPSFAKYDAVYDKSWNVAVNDEQISLMDTFYTELMGN